jgi:hypothetical protein
MGPKPTCSKKMLLRTFTAFFRSIDQGVALTPAPLSRKVEDTTVFRMMVRMAVSVGSRMVNFGDMGSHDPSRTRLMVDSSLPAQKCRVPNPQGEGKSFVELGSHDSRPRLNRGENCYSLAHKGRRHALPIRFCN